KETAAVKIRTKEGIDFKWFGKKTGFDLCELEKNTLSELIENGLVDYKTEDKHTIGICLTKKGFLFCDTVSSGFI
ncbi:MAG: hypothetical protein Q8R05_08835, partial [Candidatus Omnitrophota bacterium]|nr:hypothetical protein [Candidatus Omnitrophota bacterium]